MESNFYNQKLLSSVRKACKEYNLIEEGDKIAVGVSGGKDSLALLCAMASLRRFYPKSFDLVAVMIDPGFYEAGFGTYEDAKRGFYETEMLSKELNVEFFVKKTQIADVVFGLKKEDNPCSLCAKMRRGALQNFASELGCNKLALGHHFDDAVETFMLNLFNEGRIGCFPPKVYFDRSNITVIRPMVLTPEKDITYFVNKSKINVFRNPCPMDKNTDRERIKQLLKDLDKENRGLKKRIFGAMKRAGVDGYGDVN